MAKSARSKSIKKNKAVKRASIFKPVSDARHLRLAARDPVKVVAKMDIDNKEDEEFEDIKAPLNRLKEMSSKGSKKKWRRNKSQNFSVYGLSARESKF